MASFKNDTLVNHLYETKTQKAVIQDGNLILLPLDERYHSQEYVKADSSLVKKAKETNVTVLRLLINKTLSENTYSIKSSKTEIKFTEDGKVDGLSNFKDYYISINGDSADTRGITAIRFTTVDGSDKKLGIEFQKDKNGLSRGRHAHQAATRPDDRCNGFLHCHRVYRVAPGAHPGGWRSDLTASQSIACPASDSYGHGNQGSAESEPALGPGHCGYGHCGSSRALRD